ncbi:unnamed protein product [Arctia plantaginis]|uniref:Mononegavirus-type SAM-dependent 2'-O-MTase domain-containing protein n=1 Tax=Arctia plantaginis TaxID=874455 RepID=A0A8S0ZWI7_ARCPL|nr:unnamed protein product [Arctia plantaginis]
MELLSGAIIQDGVCGPCEDQEPYSFYVSVLVPKGLSEYKNSRGPYKAYLGSKTSEATSVLRPWERETKIPLIKRAAKLRAAIGWSEDTSIFPLSIQNKVFPKSFINGIIEGLIRAAAIHCASRRSIVNLSRPREALLGTALYLINQVNDTASLVTMWRAENFHNLFLTVPTKIPPSYPLSNKDLGSLGRSYMRSVYIHYYVDSPSRGLFIYQDIWIFADINDVKTFGMLAISTKLTQVLYSNQIRKHTKDIIRGSKDLIINLRDPERTHHNINIDLSRLKRVNEEVRHASRSIVKSRNLDRERNLPWGSELAVPIKEIQVPYVAVGSKERQDLSKVKIPRIQNPLISGLRCFQFATGSHYKIQSILKNLNIKYKDCLAGGDGSGGIGSLLLRSSRNSRLIFNSLLDLDGVDLRGSTPSPPSAISALGSASRRCVNFNDSWRNPSDLRNKETWEYFLNVKHQNQMRIDLITLDMECNSDEISDSIELQLSEYIFKILDDHGTLIYKTFLERLCKQSILLSAVGNQFKNVSFVVTDITSSQSSEIYVVMRGKNNSTIPKEPDLETFSKDLNDLPVMRGIDKEFGRAVSLLYKNICVYYL